MSGGRHYRSLLWGHLTGRRAGVAYVTTRRMWDWACGLTHFRRQPLSQLQHTCGLSPWPPRSAYPRIVALVANVAGHAPDRRTEPYWNAVPDNPAAWRGRNCPYSGIAHITGRPANYDARSPGREIFASHGGRCKHGDRDQSSRQELDCSHRTCPFSP